MHSPHLGTGELCSTSLREQHLYKLFGQLFFFFFFLFIYGCVGSSFPCEGFLPLRQAGATPHRGVRAPHHRGLSCCGAQAPDAQAQQSWLTGPAALRHAESSQTRARTRVPCTGRQTLNHCATREALGQLLYRKFVYSPHVFIYLIIYINMDPGTFILCFEI